jgi:hypothetical protein
MDQMNVAITDRLASDVRDAEDIVANLTGEQHDAIRQRVRDSIEGLDQGEFTDYLGKEGLTDLAAGIKARGRAVLAQSSGSR